MIRTTLAAVALLLGAGACSDASSNNSEAAAQAAPGSGDYMMDQIAYLARLTPDQGWQATPSGIRYRRVRGDGSGPRPSPSDTVTLHYRGTLTDGTEFDSSVGGEPVTFPLPQLIPGWQEGVPLMSVGDRFEFAIPYTSGYGPSGSGPIPGGATLLFTIDLLGIAPRGAQ